MKSEYTKYAEDVLSGKLVACEYIFLSCKRYLDWFNRTDIEFREDKCDKVVRFILKLKHYSGKAAGKPFILEDWQKWILYNIFGWYWKGTNIRVTNKVLITMARKQGKSMFAAAIALYMLLADGEPAALILNIANNVKLAHLLFDMELKCLKSIDPNRKYTKITRDTIRFDKTNSYALVLSSDSSGLDGSSPSTYILDETHEMKDSKLWDVMLSGTVYRESPLGILISTSGFNLDGFLHNYRDTAIEILKGMKEDDSLFTALYELDENDDWLDENVWIKSNPNLGVTVTKKTIRELVNNAKNNTSLEVGVRTKTLNLWCRSAYNWIPDDIIVKSMLKVDLSDFKNNIAYMGVDLSSVSDMTCFAIMFPPDSTRGKWADKYVFKVYSYLPKESLYRPLNLELYKLWSRNKQLQLTNGNCVDYDEILNDLYKLYNYVDLVAIAYDSWNATLWAINATNLGMPLFPFSQAIGNFNRGTKEIERLLLEGKVILDLNPIIRFAFNNCEIKFDYNNNCKPIKQGGDSSRKIDPVIAIILALGIFLLEGEETE